MEAETEAHKADVVWYIDNSTVRNDKDPGTVTSESGLLLRNLI